MTGITELGYVRFGVSKLAEWREFATALIGLQVGDDSEPGRLYLRSDIWHHRIILEEDGSDDLLGAGLRVAGPEEFRAMQNRLSEHDVHFAVADAATALNRRVLELLTLVDPAGNPLEIFHGPRVDTHRPFHPGRGMYGKFVTADGGVGHMILRCDDFAKTYEFYKLLGMRGSIEYRIPMLDGKTLDLMFMHCNSRDHTFAFGLPSKTRVNHLMLEVDNLDDVFLSYELIKQKYPIAIGLGKHANDEMFSFYCISPSGFQVEIGYGGAPSKHQSAYHVVDTYGHAFNRGEAGQ